ncbi:MAG: endonuclease VII domain-containing protein [Anaerolineales bacterium]
MRDTLWAKEDRRKNPEKYLSKEQIRRARDLKRLGKDEVQRRTKDYNLKHAYGISLEDYGRMLEDQDGVCAICGGGQIVTKNNNNGYLHVDHDHATGEVRGLLCHLCNQGMVAVDGCQDWPQKAAVYAAKYRRK